MKRIVVVLTALVSMAWSQGTEVTYARAAEEYFLLGMRQYAHKDFSTALQSFQLSSEAYPMNHRITASMIMIAKTQYALRNFFESAAACDSLLFRFPETSYREDALFTKGMCLYNTGDYLSSFVFMMEVRSMAQQRLNRDHSIKVIEHIAAEFLSEEQIDSLAGILHSAEILDLLSVVKIERLFARGSIPEVHAMLETLMTRVTDPALLSRLHRLHYSIDRGNSVKIGVLLPLMKFLPPGASGGRVGTEVLQGIQLALAEYAERAEPGLISIDLDIRDSQRNADSIRHIVSSFTADSSIVGIIGPLFSDETLTAATAAMEQSIPLISPTATDDSVAMTGDYIFQANTTSSMRGKVLAQYAVSVLGARTIAVIASDAPTSQMQADSFVVEAERLGGKILFNQRYKKGDVDLRDHFRRLRAIATEQTAEYLVTFRGKMDRANIMNRMVSYGFSPRVVDSIIARAATVNLTQFIGETAKELADSLKLPTKKNVVYEDSLHFPVNTIDVIFSPIASGQQIGVISSQIAYFNIRSIILGSGEWYNINELDMNRRYADGVIFGSDRWVERNERTNSLFLRYAQQYRNQISDNVLFGYDVMTMLIRLFNEGAVSRESLKESLSKVINQPGIRNSMTLQYRRINSDINILQYKDGTITKLRTYTYQP
jgi:ABC-type branched-subunit amino acid transport system substrate-binding protein